MRGTVNRLLSTRPALVWLGLVGGPIAFDVWAARNDITGDSLSECVRAGLHTETPAGKVAFVAGWTALSAWFIPHILRRVNEERN